MELEIKRPRNLSGEFISKNANKARMVLIFLAFIFLMSLFYQAFDKTVMFFRENTIVRHQMVKVTLHKPLEIVSLKELEKRATMEKTVEEMTDKVVEEYLNPPTKPETSGVDSNKFFNIIRKHESNNGKDTNPVAIHNYCRSKGMWNEIGYSPSTKYCFTDEKEARLFVAYYLKKNCDNMTLDQSLCYWNTGKIVNSCAYSRGDLANAN